MSITRRALLGGGIGLTAGGLTLLPRSHAESAISQSQLQIFFEGLCLFAAQRLSGALGDVKVLLPDVCNLPRIAGSIDVHKPLLCIPKAFLPSGATDKDCPDATMWAWALAGMDVTLSVDSVVSTAPVTAVDLNLPANYIPYADEWRDLRWLPNLRDMQVATTPPKKVARDYVLKPPSGSAVASRINLNGGTLGGSVPSGWSGRVITWGFDGCTNAPCASRMMTDIARYDSPVGQNFQINLTPAGSTTSVTTIVLRPPADGSAVPIYIRNKMLVKTKCMTVGRGNHHFMAYYDLLTGIPRDVPVPATGGKIAGFEKDCSVQGDNPIYCPPPLGEAEP